MEHDFELAVFRRIETFHRRNHFCRRLRNDEATLHRQITLGTHRAARRSFDFALRERGQIDLPKDRELGHFRSWISSEAYPGNYESERRGEEDKEVFHTDEALALATMVASFQG